MNQRNTEERLAVIIDAWGRRANHSSDILFDMNSSDTPNHTPAISRSELLWLAGAVLFGAMIRLSFPGRMAIEHFDEGVYASNFWFGADQGYAYPARHLYAPPLLPATIEWTMTVASLCGFRPTGWIPMIPCLLAGIATIPSIWWIGRRWFGPTAGLVSAWLVATSDFHACYSRAALTDVPVCLFILWAVYFIWRALCPDAISCESTLRLPKSKSKIQATPLPWRDIVLAGLFTGLAWWTKYNGWLPLAIGAAGGTLCQLLTPKSERRILYSLKCWFLIATVAGLIWSPVVWGLQKFEGGYSSVASNHRQYIVGFSGWGHSAVVQAENIGLYDNWFGIVTQPFGPPKDFRLETDRHANKSEPGISDGSKRSNGVSSDFKQRLDWAQFYSFRFATFMIPVLLLIVTSLAIQSRLVFVNNVPDRIAASLLAAWFCGMTVATPFYHPYPRLVLPWLFATWMGAGLAMQLGRNRIDAKGTNLPLTTPKLWVPRRTELIVIIWVISNSIFRSFEGTAHAWDDRTELQATAKQFSNVIERKLGGETRARGSAIVLVYGEPAMVFGFCSMGFLNVIPVPNLDFMSRWQPKYLQQPEPAFLVVGIQSFDQLSSSKEGQRLEASNYNDFAPIRPSHLVQMDSQNRERFYFPEDEKNGIERQPPGKNTALRLYRVPN